MEYKHIPAIMENMAGHINDEGQVSSRQARQQAIISAGKLGISPLEHGELMMSIHQSQSLLKELGDRSKEIEKPIKKTNKKRAVNKTANKGKSNVPKRRKR